MLKRKAEERRRRENSEKRKRLEQERQNELEMEKQKLIKERERKVALDDWLRNKRAEDKRKNSMAKFVSKKGASSFGNHQNHDKQMDKSIAHTLLPQKMKAVIYDPNVAQNLSQGLNNSDIIVINNSSKQQPQVLMNMQNVAKTININNPKNQSDLESSMHDIAPLDGSALVLRETGSRSFELPDANSGHNL